LSELGAVSDQEGAGGPDPRHEKFADTARQAIERRVLAELEHAFGENAHSEPSSLPGDAPPSPGRAAKWLLLACVVAAACIGLVWLVVRLF